MDFTKTKFINDMLLQHDYPTLYEPDYAWSFCVHASIMPNLEKAWDKLFVNTKRGFAEFILQIDTKLYDMRILIVTQTNDPKIKFLRETIKNSQFSFPWEDNPTLFISVTSYHIMKQFIFNHNLESYILNVEDKPGVSANGETIKVVTFDQSVSNVFNVVELFDGYLKSNSTDHQPIYYYMTFCFPWLQPYWLQQIYIRHKTYSTFHITLGHLGTLNVLHLFDLLAMRLALFDVTNTSPSSLVRYEIDFMIKRILNEIIKDGHLNLDDYAVDKNYVQRDFMIAYMVYEFQNFFDTVQTSRGTPFHPEIKPYKIRGRMVLVHESDNILLKLKLKNNIEFNVDGTGYEGMSLSLFLDLVECDNVLTIFLDTDQTWCSEECPLNRAVSNPEGVIDVYLRGSNLNHFIEQFVSSLGTVTWSKGQISLHIFCDLSDYKIFDNLLIGSLYLYNIIIRLDVLEALHQSNLNSKIYFIDCTFENTSHNWDLLYDLKGLWLAEIHEDEGTWQSFFEFISCKVLKSSTNEFKFDTPVMISSLDKSITFATIQFRIDEVNSKLELRDLLEDDNKIIDLYDLKFNFKADDKCDYDFYQ